MRKTINVLVLAALAAFTFLLPAVGQAVEPPPGQDRFGIYTAEHFDDPLMDDHLPVAGPSGTLYNFPFIITGMTAPSCRCVEFIVTHDPGIAFSGFTWNQNNIDIDSSPTGVIAGFAEPAIPVYDGTDYAFVGTADILVFTDQPVLIYLNPHTTPSIPGFMTYCNGLDIGDLKEVLPSSGAFELPIFGINTDVQVRAESATWSSVKDLFR
ncbi:MAG: hypothetical protein R6X25_11540 [Candidatus Krumholzibacteriia bacterium]